jgi:hypothetical protein
MQTGLLEGLADKTVSKKELLQKAEADPSLIPLLLDGTGAEKASVRYGCGAVLMELSQKQPKELYMYWNRFVSLLDSKYRILTWNALAVLANLTKVDTEGKFEALFDLYFGFLGNPYMVTVANTVENAATIAENKPELADRILFELLKVECLKITPHLTEECKLVIAEKALGTFNVLIPMVKDKQAMIDFALKYQNSSRVSLQKQAQRFLSNWG